MLLGLRHALLILWFSYSPTLVSFFMATWADPTRGSQDLKRQLFIVSNGSYQVGK